MLCQPHKGSQAGEQTLLLRKYTMADFFRRSRPTTPFSDCSLRNRPPPSATMTDPLSVSPTRATYPAAPDDMKRLRQRDPVTGHLIPSDKWAQVGSRAATSSRMEKASRRLRAASVKREAEWDPMQGLDTPCAWLPEETFAHKSVPTARKATSTRSVLRRSDLVREKLQAWWEMVACASGNGSADDVGFATYVELQLRLHKVLVPPPFDRGAAEREAEESWAHECPKGGRTLNRHLLQDSLFDLVDQRTRSTTAEECAAFLDLLFSQITSGCPPSMRRLGSIGYVHTPRAVCTRRMPYTRRVPCASACPCASSPRRAHLSFSPPLSPWA